MKVIILDVQKVIKKESFLDTPKNTLFTPIHKVCVMA